MQAERLHVRKHRGRGVNRWASRNPEAYERGERPFGIPDPEPAPRCTCGSTEPDECGNRDQIEDEDCPMHGIDPPQVVE